MALASKKYLFAAFSLVAAAIIYVHANLPISHTDDFYFFGVAENLLKSGKLENPYFSEEYYEGLRSEKFHFQPPFYPWLLSIWMGAFGINLLSISLFSFSITSIGAFGIWGIGRIFSVQWQAVACTVITYFLCMARLGLRPEVAAFSLFFLGTFLLFRSSRFPFVPFLLIGLSIGFYPITIIAGFLMLWVAFYFNCLGDLKKSLSFVSQGLLAAVVLVSLFAFLIEFHFLEFFSTYLLTTKAQNPGPPFTIERMARFVEMLSLESRYLPKWPYIALASSVYLILLATRKLQGRLAVFLGILLLACIGAGGLNHIRSVEFTTFVAFTVLFFAAGCLLKNKFAFYLGVGFLLCLALVANLYTVSYIFLQKPLPISDQKTFLEKVSFASSNKSRVLVDSHVIRYIFEWNIPPGFKDFHASRPLLGPDNVKIFPRSSNQLQKEEFVILSKHHSFPLWSDEKPRPSVFLGFKIHQIPFYYCEPFLVDFSE